MMDYGKKARDLFEGGHNCAQASYGAFCEHLGQDFEDSMALSAPFGGGLGKLREVCGAVSGMLMAYGLYSGGYEINNDEDKTGYYAKVRELCARFEQEYGSILCRDLLGLPEGENLADLDARKTPYFRRPCADFVEGAAKILMEEMSKGK